MRDPALPLLTPARPRRSCHRCPAPWRCLGGALPPVSRRHDLDGRATAALPRGDVLAPLCPLFHAGTTSTVVPPPPCPLFTRARPRGSCRRRHAPWGCLG